MSLPAASPSRAPAPVGARTVVPVGGRALARVGERFYAGELRVTLALIVVASLLAAVLAVLGTLGSGSWRSVALALIVAVVAGLGMWQAGSVYVTMRARPVLSLLPAALIGTLLALDGGLDSPLYIPAQAVPVMAALTGSISLAVAASGVVGALYLVGVVASGGQMSADDQFIALASVFGFVAWAIVFGVFAHALTAFVMRLPVLASVDETHRRRARRVPVVVHRSEPGAAPVPSELPFRLTARQLQVAVLIAEGLSSAAIARELGIAASTVDRHATTAMRQAGVASRSQLAALIVASGLMDREPE